jgi:hypothetical protein
MNLPAVVSQEHRRLTPPGGGRRELTSKRLRDDLVRCHQLTIIDVHLVGLLSNPDFGFAK